MNIGVLGGGSWGTTVAHLLSRRYDVTLWARNSDIANEINAHRTNRRYLLSAQLSQNCKQRINYRSQRVVNLFWLWPFQHKIFERC